MHNEIKAAFESVHANDAMKARTMQFVSDTLAKKQKPYRRALFNKWAVAAYACLLLCAAAAGYALYFTPSLVISMDINPSIELQINRFGKVIGTNAYNEDGEALAQSVSLLHKDYDEAVKTVVQSESMQQYLKEDEFLSIAVVSENEAQSDEVYAAVSQYTQNKENIECCKVNESDVADAHTFGLSYGKYRMYLEVLAYDQTITPEQVKGMTMREIKNLLDEEQQDTQSGQQNGNGSAQQGANQDGQGNKHQYGPGGKNQ